MFYLYASLDMKLTFYLNEMTWSDKMYVVMEIATSLY